MTTAYKYLITSSLFELGFSPHLHKKIYHFQELFKNI